MLLVVKSFVTRCKICLLLVAEVARCKILLNFIFYLQLTSSIQIIPYAIKSASQKIFFFKSTTYNRIFQRKHIFISNTSKNAIEISVIRILSFCSWSPHAYHPYSNQSGNCYWEINSLVSIWSTKIQKPWNAMRLPVGYK